MSSLQDYRKLSLPTGTETLQLHEAARHRRITRTLEDLFSAWGYEPAETALVDYFDVYRRLLSDDGVAQMYRAVDRHGEILALRSDTTLFLAKQLGLHLTADDLPVRVFYNDQIVRAEDRHDISNNEYQQAGIELVGAPGAEADAEVLLLAVEALRSLGLEDAAIHIGSHAVAEAASAALGMEMETVVTTVKHRAFHQLTRSTISDQDTKAVEDLLAFMGPPAAFDAAVAAASNLPASLSEALQELQSVVSLLLHILPDGWGDRIRIDLSELGTYRYYTGIAFSAYIPHSNAAILRGGRYDHLLKAFGFDAPSVGFSLFTRKLPFGVLASDDGPARGARGDDLPTRVADARNAQQHGKRVHL